MSEDDDLSDADDEEFDRILDTYQSALAAGTAEDSLPAIEVPPRLEVRVKRALACLIRLRMARPQLQPGEGHTPLPRGDLPLGIVAGEAIHIGRFEIVRELGRGGFGIVYLAYDKMLRREVAVKVPRPEVLADAELRARFVREARLAAALDHPNLVPVLDVHDDGVVCYLVTAYCPGSTLHAWLREHTEPVPARVAIAIVTAIADAVSHVHGRGILHRDIKPGNVLLEPVTRGSQNGDNLNVVPRLTDFGLAKLLEGQTEDHTRTGALLGTPAYMAPEQANSALAPVGPATDVYALGVVLYELLTGQTPFRGTTSADTLRQVLNDEPVSPRRLRGDLPRDLDTVCLKCLQKEPAGRYVSATALVEDLQHWLKGEPIQARPVGWAGQLGRWCRRNPVLSPTIALTTIALVALSVVTLLWGIREHGHAQDLTRALNDAHYRRAENLFDRGVSLCERGDEGAGLLWMTLALQKLPPHSGALEQTIRTQLAWWGARVSPLKDCRDLPVPLTAAAMSPDGNTVWAAGTDGQIRCWDIRKDTIIELSLPPAHKTRAIVWSPKGQLVLTIAEGKGAGTAQLWSAATGQPFGKPLPDQIRSAAWGGRDGNILVTCSETGNVCRWELKDTSTARALVKLPRSVDVLAISPDGSLLLTGTEQGQLWDASTGKLLADLASSVPAGRVVTAAAFSPSGNNAVLAYSDFRTQLWDVEQRQALHGPVTHNAPVETIAFSPDGVWYLTGGRGRSAQLWEVETNLPAGAPLLHKESVRCTAFSTDGTKLFTASTDGALRIRRFSRGNLSPRVLRHDINVRTAAFSSDGRLVVTTSWRNATVWNLTTQQHVDLPHPKQVLTAAFSSDGNKVLTVCWDNHIRLWDWATQKVICPPLRQHPTDEGVSKALLSPDGKTVLAGFFKDDSIRFWNVETGDIRGPFRGMHKGSFTSLGFSSDGRLACTAGKENAWVWDTKTAQTIPPVLTHPDKVWTVAFGGTGPLLLTGSFDNRARVWDLRTGGRLQSVLSHGHVIRDVALSSDGLLALSGSEDGTAILWNTGTGAAVGPPLVHHDFVVAVALSPDGRTALTGSWDHTARLWDTATGKPISPPLVHQDRVLTVAFSADGTAVLTASDDKTARLWNLPRPSAAAADQILLRNETDVGLMLDDTGVINVLDAARWRERQDRVSESN
jgi:eukaryotic-like serine/threonine-protein kinase